MIENQGTALAANSIQNSKIPLKAEATLALFAHQATKKKKRRKIEKDDDLRRPNSSTKANYKNSIPTQQRYTSAAGGHKPFAATIRTSPPSGLPGVDAIT
jgi:hypothetical protein